ncbi:response regulator transcription factor [Bifidobacterium pullorum subsp. saeculare]|uniref:LytR/AlgR family response regulator transcription factor n=1 Tax=Bifidobacterium pullorum TaxID=78448 RepID=UPI00195890CE|nr:LytTR family DNA-binding domain-containing protein [Bifidobacterium pullorum]MBM6696244.1 response regulator transcription factor [Bifidobacterium pullorum subsp. saeculare]
MITIALVDDDDADARVTASMIDRYFDGDASRYAVTRFADGDSLLRDYKASFDLMFLDVEMPGTDGVTVARRLRVVDDQTVLVFTTKMAQYAVEGYDVDAIGYLLKPLNYYAFAIKMRKAEDIVARRRSVTVPLTVGSETVFVPSADIRYVEVLDHALLYHTGEGIRKVWASLKDAAETLEPVGFVPVSRYCLVNLEWVRAVHGDDVDVDGERVRVSRSRRKSLMQALAAYHGG